MEKKQFPFSLINRSGEGYYKNFDFKNKKVGVFLDLRFFSSNNLKDNQQQSNFVDDLLKVSSFFGNVTTFFAYSSLLEGEESIVTALNKRSLSVQCIQGYKDQIDKYILADVCLFIGENKHEKGSVVILCTSKEDFSQYFSNFHSNNAIMVLICPVKLVRKSVLRLSHFSIDLVELLKFDPKKKFILKEVFPNVEF